MSNDKKHKEDRPIWLTSLADADRDADVPSSNIEERLQGALRRRRHSILFKRSGGLAAVAGLAFVLWLRPLSISSIPYQEVAEDTMSDVIAEAASWDVEDGSDFVPTRLASEQPLESVRVVRVSLPAGALASYGIASNAVPTSASGEVTADLLVGQDGIARAVRVIK